MGVGSSVAHMAVLSFARLQVSNCSTLESIECYCRDL